MCPGVSSLDNDEEKFLVQSENVAGEFLTLFMSDNKKGTQWKSPNLFSVATKQAELVRHDPTSLAVARRLREIGDGIQDKVDAELTAILAKQSLMEMGLEQFTRMCRNTLTRCSSSITNGWQQVFTVYYSMARIVDELRQQTSVPESSRSLREIHLQRFVGSAMQDLGIDSWVESNGGLVSTHCL